MAESPFTGLTAKLSVKVGGGTETQVAYVSGVDLTIDKTIIEILAFGMQYKEKVPAIKDWHCSIDGTVAFETGGSQQQFFNAFESADKVQVKVFLDDNNYFEGDGYVESFNVSAAPDDAITLTSDIAGSGAVTLTLGSAGG